MKANFTLSDGDKAVTDADGKAKVTLKGTKMCIRDRIISGCHAPHLHSERQLSHRDDADFIAELIDIGGCSPLSFFSEERKGDIIARMSADVTVVENSLTSSIDSH